MEDGLVKAMHEGFMAAVLVLAGSAVGCSQDSSGDGPVDGSAESGSGGGAASGGSGTGGDGGTLAGDGAVDDGGGDGAAVGTGGLGGSTGSASPCEIECAALQQLLCAAENPDSCLSDCEEARAFEREQCPDEAEAFEACLSETTVDDYQCNEFDEISLGGGLCLAEEDELLFCLGV